MTLSELELLETSDQFCDIAGTLPITQAEDGSIGYYFLMGWKNAMDMLDSGEITKGDNATFKRFALSEARNYYS